MNYFDNGDRFAQPGQAYPTRATAQTSSGFVFDIRRFGGRTTVSQQVLETAEMSSEWDHILEGLIVGIDVKVLSHHLLSRSQTQTVEFPANPWQHLKARFGPAWFIGRWPVRKASTSITFQVDVDAAFPQATIPLSEPRLGPASFHESGHFETETYGHPYITYRQGPMSYQQLRSYYADAADREARIRKEIPRSW
jgi:hypothetical protein